MLSKSAFSRSILFTKIMRGRFASSASFQHCSVPTCTPEVAQTTINALSTALNAPLTSATKSAKPGVSMKLILVLRHSTGAKVAFTETLRLISSGS